MEGIASTTTRRRKAANWGFPANGAAPAIRAAVKLRPGALRALFDAENIHGLEAQVAALQHSSLGALHRAYNGGTVSTYFIAAVRLRFPTVPYEQLFVESEEAGHEPAHAAA